MGLLFFIIICHFVYTGHCHICLLGFLCWLFFVFCINQRVFHGEIIINIYVRSFPFIWKPMLWIYSHYIYLLSAGIDFRRQNMTSIYVRIWRPKSVPALEGFRWAEIISGKVEMSINDPAISARSEIIVWKLYFDNGRYNVCLFYYLRPILY